MASYSRDLACLVTDVQDDKHKVYRSGSEKAGQTRKQKQCCFVSLGSLEMRQGITLVAPQLYCIVGNWENCSRN